MSNKTKEIRIETTIFPPDCAANYHSSFYLGIVRVNGFLVDQKRDTKEVVTAWLENHAGNVNENILPLYEAMIKKYN